MKKTVLLIALIILTVSLCSCKKTESETRQTVPTETKQSVTAENTEKATEGEKMTATVKINGNEYRLLLEDNETASAFSDELPLTLAMGELNGNEKYHYLDHALPNDEKSVVMINKGDVMLYGDRCVVVFYKSFATAYKYTKIGSIENPDSLETDLGEADVKVEFYG